MFSWLAKLFSKMYDILSEIIAKAVESKIGTREEGGENKGKDLQPFFDSDWYDPNGSKAGDDGYAWCAAFVCWAVKEASSKIDIAFSLPRTPRAWGFEDWAKAQGEKVDLKKPHLGDINRGDIVIFKFSHIGVAVSDLDSSEFFSTVEGNTNSKGSREGDGVYRKLRHASEIRSRIRLLS